MEKKLRIENNLDELYKVYGSLIIQFDILQAKINATKQQIVNEMRRQSQIKDNGDK